MLAFNPSHLEIINPVVEGSVRARQERRGDSTRGQVLPILIHGDAAFSGQGVVTETLNLSETRGYGTGGTVHVVVNNQIGFTTSDPLDSRSTLYCTDVAKLVQAPIFHVNGNDAEAVVFITQIALDFRMRFKKDVVIDMICFRRYGHNEADEPLATQPMMYRKIRGQQGPRKVYGDRLVAEGVIEPGEPEAMSEAYLAGLEADQTMSRPLVDDGENEYLADWTPYFGTGWRAPCDTTVAIERIERLGRKLCEYPADDFELHRSVKRIIDARLSMARGERPMDWGFAENLAYAALLEDGYSVRLSGQDSQRGTFFHRHAVLHNQKRFGTYTPLEHLFEGQPRFRAINSLLSEVAVLGFEYGYCTAEPEGLTIWEAQFGDFANVAQIVIDQFLSSSEAKWGRFCGLVLMLPHGYDGQGPEHSSARLERFLQLCAEDNMQVCVPTTPAQMFHLLRRQLLRPYRKPLVVMSPKSLLRHRLSTSTREDLCAGGFQVLIDERRDRSDRAGGGDAARAVLRQGLLRPPGAAARGGDCGTSPSRGWSSSTRSRKRRSGRSSTRIRKSPRSAGRRRSRATREAGSSCSRGATSPAASGPGTSWSTRAATTPRPPPPATTTCTPNSSRRWSRPPSGSTGSYRRGRARERKRQEGNGRRCLLPRARWNGVAPGAVLRRTWRLARLAIERAFGPGPPVRDLSSPDVRHGSGGSERETSRA